jgi:chaperonin GroES
MKLRPLGDRLVVTIQEEKEITPTGLMLPESAKETPQRGEVIAVGNGRRNHKGKRIPMDVKVGDTVLYAKYGGSELKVDGMKLLILQESDVLAVIES